MSWHRLVQVSTCLEKPQYEVVLLDMGSCGAYTNPILSFVLVLSWYNMVCPISDGIGWYGRLSFKIFNEIHISIEINRESNKIVLKLSKTQYK